MRETGSGWAVQHSSRAWTRALRLAAVALGIGMVMSAGIARAQDEEEEDLSIDQKIIKGIMTGLGGTNMENTGIDYRERSPLVVPPKITLPPPDTPASTANVPNWPKDPDVEQRKAALAAARAPSANPLESARALTPREMAMQRAKPKVQDTTIPGDPNRNIVLSPTQLGVSSGMFKNLFGSNKGETAPFKGEPTREALTQPPVGYQTPSPEYAYGTGPKEVMRNSSNLNPMTGKY